MTARIASEGELIATYLAPLTRRIPGALGLKDDCGILVVPPGADLVVTADAVAAGVHFFDTDSAASIAWKALAVNVSDLAAKGAVPFAYQMALSFPQAPEHSWMAEFSTGLEAAQSAFGVGLLGGDTDRRPGPLSITITAFGHVPKGRMVLRSGARPGDTLFVTGTLGDSALGLRLRFDPAHAEAWGLNASHRELLAQRYLRPLPRVLLRAPLLQYATAAMDISDGLVKDAERLCAGSHAGAVIGFSKLPLSDAVKQAASNDASIAPSIVAGGDDYEILCAVAPGEAVAFAEAAAAAGCPVTAIGEVKSELGVIVIEAGGRAMPVQRGGWDHF